MTSIKPPVPPVIPGAIESVESATRAESSGAAAQAAGVQPAGPVGPSGQADPIAELAAAIARGELSAAQAMDRMVDRALAGVSAHLDGAQRAELAGVLRAALDGDPAVRDALGTETAG